MKNLKNMWNALPLRTKVTTLISSVVVFIILLMGIVVYQSRKNNSIRDNTDRMTAHINDLYNLFDLNYIMVQDMVQLAHHVATEMVGKAGQFSIDTIWSDIDAVDQQSRESSFTSLQPILINGQSLLHNYELVDEIKIRTGATATIFQRFSDGYLRISTNVMDQSNQRAVGTFIPLSSPVAQALSNGEIYKGRAFVVDQYYSTIYSPILIDGMVEGALYVGIPEKDLGYLTEKFLGVSYISSAFPFAVDSNGDILIHPTMQGSNIKETELFSKIVNSQIKNGDIYLWPENDKNASRNRLFFKYFEPYDTYVCLSVSDYDFVGKTKKQTLIMVSMAVLASVIIISLTVGWVMLSITRPINDLERILEKLSLGVLVDRYKTNRKDEIGKITTSLNKLILGLRETAHFANEIEKKNFEHPFSPLSTGDVLGNALIDMRQSLKNAAEEDIKRQKEDQKRNWTAEGLARFGEILRQNNDDLDELSFSIIKNLVKYLDINQGGIFILNDDQEDDKHLQLTACYAFDRKKYREKRIEFGEGLVGACYVEKKTIYLKKIPQNYISITSGLGDATPQILLIVPLLINDTVYGIIELASFRNLDPHEIDFIERIAESIASTLSSVKVNMRTAYLLEQSQQQAEEMKAQEEEMRQNMEEMHATQEEMARRQEEYKLRDHELEKLNYAMGERLKELKGTNQVISILQNGNSLEEKLGNIVNSLPAAWQYPANTVARILVSDLEYSSRPSFSPTPWVLSQKFEIDSTTSGELQVFYTIKYPEDFEGPFLKEERDLINNITFILSQYLKANWNRNNSI